jgi:hypothetical protein
MCKYIHTVDGEPVFHALAVKHTQYLQKTKQTPKIRNKDGYQDCQVTDNNIILFWNCAHVNTTANILCGISIKISETDWFGSFINTSSGDIIDFFNKPTWSMDIHQVLWCHAICLAEWRGMINKWLTSDLCQVINYDLPNSYHWYMTRCRDLLFLFGQ